MTLGPAWTEWNNDEQMRSLEIKLQLRVVPLDQITPRVPGFNDLTEFFNTQWAQKDKNVRWLLSPIESTECNGHKKSSGSRYQNRTRAQMDLTHRLSGLFENQ